MYKKSIRFLYYIALTMFTTVVLLSEFVIPHGGEIVDTDLVAFEDFIEDLNLDDNTTDDSNDDNNLVDLVASRDVPDVLENATVLGTYTSDTVAITIYEVRLYQSQVYVADVTTTSAGDILSALAYDSFGGKNIVQTVSTMAENNDAIFAMNADYASHYDTGIVIRNGQILRTSISYRSAVALWADGSVSTFKESSTTAASLLSAGAWQVWSFGPVLIENGISVADNNDGLSRDAVDNPRAAFGMVEANHFMMITVDGRSEVSTGVTIEELADIMAQLGCVEAYNFDGGGSATMWFDGEVINHPSEGDEREVGDCVYIAQ